MLWKNDKGVDKDVRTLLTKSNADILVYLVRDNPKNRNAYSEIVKDFRDIGLEGQLFKLKPFWIPEYFDADNDQTRNLVEGLLKKYIVRDILFNVIFGNLAADDIRFLLDLPGVPGLYLAVLHEITIDGFASYSVLSKKIKVSVNPTREKVLMLLSGGLLSRYRNGSLHVTLKGRVFLELVGKLMLEMKQGIFTSELRYILNWLKLEPLGSANLWTLLNLSLTYNHDNYGLAYALLTDIKAWANQNGKVWNLQAEQDFLMKSTIANAWGWPNQFAFARLLQTVYYVEQEWGIDFSKVHHKLDHWEKEDDTLWERNFKLNEIDTSTRLS